MKIIFNALIPVFLIIILGWGAIKYKFFEKEAKKVLSRYLIYFAFPALLFSCAEKLGLSNVSIKFVEVFFMTLLLMYIMSLLFNKFVFKIKGKNGAINAFCCSFPNTSFLGIPILAIVLGKSSMAPIIVGNIIISFTIIPLMIMICSFVDGDSSFLKQGVKNIWETIKSPMVFAPILGAVFAGLHLRVPIQIDGGIKMLGESTYACALFIIGLTMAEIKFKFNLNILTNVIFKLLVNPLIGLILGLLFGLHGFLFKVMLLLFAMPTAVTPTIYSHHYESYEDGAACSLFWSTFLSPITIGIIIFIIIHFNF